MAQCPVCSGPVADDFGLIECPQCGAQLIVHVDGHVEYSGSQGGRGESAQDSPVVEEETGGPPIHHFDELESGSASAAESEFNPELVPESGSDHVPEFDTPPEFEAPAEQVPAEAEPASDIAMFDGSEPPETGEPPAVYQAPGTQVASSPDLSDLADFANSPESGGREGPLRYNVEVTGIDTSDVREAFKEAITDRKFLWDTDQILRSIRQGEVRILNVSPGKAYILVSRLRNLPVKVKWEQYAITQA